MKVQSMGIAVLAEPARLAPLGRIEIQVRPVQLRRLVAPAWDGNQEPGKITPDRLSQAVCSSPKAAKLSQREIVRAGLRRLGPALPRDLSTYIDWDVSGVMAPVEEARQGPETGARTRRGRKQLSYVTSTQVHRGRLLGFHLRHSQAQLRQFVCDVLGGRQPRPAHLGALRQGARIGLY